MSTQTTVSTTGERPRRVRALDIGTLVGSGDRIGKLTAPFLVIGLGLNIWRPALFSVGGPPMALKVASAILLVPGVTIWLWSVVLILTRVPYFSTVLRVVNPSYASRMNLRYARSRRLTRKYFVQAVATSILR